MAFNQLNEELNDAFETYFPKMNPAVRLPYGATTRALAWGMKARTRLFGGQIKVNERIVEYPQRFRITLNCCPQGKFFAVSGK